VIPEIAMVQRTVTHASFTLKRNYPASPAKVFAAFADPAKKAKWFGGPEEWIRGERAFDFRVGGKETTSGGPKGGPMHIFNAIYHDIVPNERIVYSYDLYLDQTRISVSLTAIEIKPDGEGTLLIFTEHGAFLDGIEDPKLREHGTNELLNMLGRALPSL